MNKGIESDPEDRKVTSFQCISTKDTTIKDLEKMLMLCLTTASCSVSHENSKKTDKTFSIQEETWSSYTFQPNAQKWVQRVVRLLTR